MNGYFPSVFTTRDRDSKDLTFCEDCYLKTSKREKARAEKISSEFRMGMKENRPESNQTEASSVESALSRF